MVEGSVSGWEEVKSTRVGGLTERNSVAMSQLEGMEVDLIRVF